MNWKFYALKLIASYGVGYFTALGAVITVDNVFELDLPSLGTLMLVITIPALVPFGLQTFRFIGEFANEYKK